MLTAAMLATPLFGLSLTPPSMGVAPQLGTPTTTLQLRVPALTAAPGPASPASPEEAAEEQSQAAEGDFAGKLKRRAEIAKIHKPMGIATWSAMTITMVLGGIQYHNLYGFGDGRDSNPCVTGDAIFGQNQCHGTPWLHLSAGLVTTALYGTTAALSFLMPDPGGLDQGDSEFAKTLRTHKLLRWVHLGGMVAQLALGLVIANGQAFGLDRANDYKTLRALSTVHLGTGLITYGALTWAGGLMVF
jgi:hypothetical protein